MPTRMSSIQRSAPAAAELETAVWHGVAGATFARIGAAGQPAMRPLVVRITGMMPAGVVSILVLGTLQVPGARRRKIEMGKPSHYMVY